MGTLTLLALGMKILNVHSAINCSPQSRKKQASSVVVCVVILSCPAQHMFFFFFLCFTALSCDLVNVCTTVSGN